MIRLGVARSQRGDGSAAGAKTSTRPPPIGGLTMGIEKELRIQSRREALGILGAVGVSVLVGCGADASGNGEGSDGGIGPANDSGNSPGSEAGNGPGNGVDDAGGVDG